MRLALLLALIGAMVAMTIAVSGCIIVNN